MPHSEPDTTAADITTEPLPANMSQDTDRDEPMAEWNAPTLATEKDDEKMRNSDAKKAEAREDEVWDGETKDDETQKRTDALGDDFADVNSEDEFPDFHKPEKKIMTLGSSADDLEDDISLPDDMDELLNAADPDVMRSFYQRLFPWKYLFQWLNHSPVPTNDFAHREFAYTLPNDAYWRYQSFTAAEALKKDVLRHMPTRFEIGPVYNMNPRDRKTMPDTSKFKPLSKELCFDIDLTDYDDIRTCCDKANICIKCWQFITMAIKVVDTALREDFAFKHILWVYSGRRGAHAWVCDKKARALDDQKRRAVAGYLDIIRGGAQSGKKVNLRRPLHPHIVRSLELLKSHFQEDVLESQDPWQTPARAEKLIQLLPDKQLNDALRKKWEASPERDSHAKWRDIDSVAKSGASKSLDARVLLEAKQDIVLEYTYPRLDIEVSKKLNHLLKSPFVVHPGTGRVCIPIDMRSLESFDPLQAPTVQTLLREIDAWKEPEGGELMQDWEKTSLKPHIEYFRSFVLALLKDESPKGKRERDGAEGMDF